MDNQFEFSIKTMMSLSGNGDADAEYLKWFVSACESMVLTAAKELGDVVDGRFPFDRHSEATARASLARVRLGVAALADCADWFKHKERVAERFLIAGKHVEAIATKAESDFLKVLKLLALA